MCITSPPQAALRFGGEDACYPSRLNAPSTITWQAHTFPSRGGATAWRGRCMLNTSLAEYTVL